MVKKSKHSKVGEIMQRNVYTINPNQSVFDASVVMAYERIGSLPVVKDDKTLVGILTDRDIVTKCNAVGKDIRKAKVFECMTTNPIRTVPSASIGDAMMLMGKYGIRRLPIVEKDKLVGLVSAADIALVSDFCPNLKCPDETCILLDMAKGLEKSSLCCQSFDSCQRQV